MFDAFRITEEFTVAIAEADCTARALQLKERIEAVVADLITCENLAMEKAEVLSRARGKMS